jgi:hypothetical protein
MRLPDRGDGRESRDAMGLATPRASAVCWCGPVRLDLECPAADGVSWLARVLGV